MRNNKNTTFQTIAFGFFIFTMIFIFGIVEPFNQEQQAQEDAEAYNTREIIDASIIDMYDAYKNNELNGERLYKDKWVRFTVYFDKVHKTFTGQIAVYFDASEEYEFLGDQARCDNMSEIEEAKIVDFNKGEAITVIGLNDGMLSSTTMSFDNCEFPEY